MKLSAKIIVAVAAVALCAAACARGPRIIPKSKMEKIYTEVLLADQWLAVNNQYSVEADTTLFYETIFRKYGYDTEDFRASLEYYMRDPLRMSRMMKDIALRMETEAAKLQATYEEYISAAREEDKEETDEE